MSSNVFLGRSKKHLIWLNESIATSTLTQWMSLSRIKRITNLCVAPDSFSVLRFFRLVCGRNHFDQR